MLADAYDAIKAIDTGVNVIGLGLSPRGSGDGRSLFPVQFLAQLGAAYKTLNRSAPLLDAISFHPYPFPEDKAPDRTSDWPTIGLADLARLKQAVWDAFNGTGQKTVDAGLNPRPVVSAVKQALAATSGGTSCSTTPVSWQPETGVVGFDAGFGSDGKTALANGSKVWGFAPSAQEDATYTAGVFPAGTTGADATRALAVHRRLAADTKPLFTTAGKIRAMLKSLAKFELNGKDGSYVYAVTVTSTTNPSRSETAVSGPFTVGATRSGTTIGATAKPQLRAGRRNQLGIVPQESATDRPSPPYTTRSRLRGSAGDCGRDHRRSRLPGSVAPPPAAPAPRSPGIQPLPTCSPQPTSAPRSASR